MSAVRSVAPRPRSIRPARTARNTLRSPMRRRRAQRGQVMVEVAVVFPLLVFIALGLVQFAIYYHVHNVVQAGVQEAARTAAAIGGSRDLGIARGEALIAAGYHTPQPVQ